MPLATSSSFITLKPHRAVAPLASGCPCCSGRLFSACCAPYLARAAIPSTAEALMRSRYTAYALADAAYLKSTWHPNTLPEHLNLSEQAGTKWLGLKIIRHEGVDENHAIVEFVARYKIHGKAHRLHEVSRFERIAGCWYYVDGAFQ